MPSSSTSTFVGEKFVKVIAMRPVTFFIFLTIAVLLLPSIMIPYWYHMMKKIEHNVDLEANHSRYQLVSKIEEAGKLVFPINSSANNLANVLGSIIEDDQLSFSVIRTKVARALFEASLMLPHSTQASYIGLDGLFFSYIINGDRTYAIYSNSSFSSNTSGASSYTWYTQPVKSDTGVLYGDAEAMKPVVVVNETWFQRAMNSSDGYASLGYRWTSSTEGEPDLFVDVARLSGKGAISLGFDAKELANVFSSFDHNGGSLYMATLGDHAKVLLEGTKDVNIRIDGDKTLVQDDNNNTIGEIPCKFTNVATNGGCTTLDIGGTSLIFYCSRIDIARVPTVYVLTFPSNGLVRSVHKHTKVALILLILMMVGVVVSIFAFVALIVRAARREVHLCAAYMRQMDKTNQAERKSMKQSLAFASTNHDIRGYLACIKGLIELSYHDVPPSSELASNLKKMEVCAEDLLALVNSILDLSKIEAGKMELEEREFEMAKLLEDIADLHHAVAMKKGIDVILDPCDGSIMKYSRVVGDGGKLKQILGNLLSNAVKFTPNGHIVIRAWAKKPSLESSIIASNKNNLFLNRLSQLFCKNKRAYKDVEEMRSIKQDPNCMEFEFEVEDTGPGIPKEKRESIFENFVQVKENSTGQLGTGLGLGIVQSLVRLMGGDIEIVDKANGEKGTCFKFNIFLIVKENNNTPVDDLMQDNRSIECHQHLLSPRFDSSIVVLLIESDERRRVVQRYMESLGIKLVVVRQASHLPKALKKKVKPKLVGGGSWSSSGSATYLSSGSDRCIGGPRLLPLDAMDGVDNVLPVYRRGGGGGSVRCTLLVVDANAGNFSELRRSVAEFRKDHLRTCIKVVWLERPDTSRAHFGGLQGEGGLPPTDCIISGPLHGSRLTRVIKLLPEFGGQLVSAPSMRNNKLRSEAVELESSSSGRSVSRMRIMSTYGEIQEIGSESSDKERHHYEKPLLGKKILVVGTKEFLIKTVAKDLSSKFGAFVEVCQNGTEVVGIVCRALRNRTTGASRLPYDYILMQTEMEVMNGYEATKFIRNEEEKYGVHIPVLGLTSDGSRTEGQRISAAGMDFHLTTPLTTTYLLEAFRRVDSLVREVPKNVGGPSSSKPLQGKKFLIAEDSPIGRQIVVKILTQLGAYVEACEDGKDALELISKALRKLATGGPSVFPYDYVLMDCEMKVMHGFEATKRIREEEKKYGIHIPIIALTAHEAGEEGRKIAEAGMDFHLTKPLKKEKLLEALRFVSVDVS